MVWYFIGVYIINRTLHGRLEIRNFSSRVEKNISLFRCPHSWNIFQHSKRNFVSLHGHVISSISSGWHIGFPNIFYAGQWSFRWMVLAHIWPIYWQNHYFWALSTDIDAIAKALRKSEAGLVEVCYKCMFKYWYIAALECSFSKLYQCYLYM